MVIGISHRYSLTQKTTEFNNGERRGLWVDGDEDGVSIVAHIGRLVGGPEDGPGDGQCDRCFGRGAATGGADAKGVRDKGAGSDK